ncbi:MAG TPA: hypothetical protein VGM54_21480 [Chthoniobacter sp.]|jgi:hypothetical protein
MPEIELPWVFTEPLDRAEIGYMVVGAFATMAFGVYRTTTDLDLVISLTPGDVRKFESTFPEADYYRPPRETLIEESRRTARGHFNLVHQATQERADCYLAGTDPLQHWGLKNRRAIELRGRRVWVAPPELVILKKLEFYREGESMKHVRDIRSVLEIVQIDRVMLEQQIERLGLREQWLACQPPGH